MVIEGVILYLMLVKVFPTTSKGPKKKLFFICSWGKLFCIQITVESNPKLSLECLFIFYRPMGSEFECH